MTPILIAFIVFVATGAGLTLWARHKHTDTQPQVTAVQRNADLLAKLHWREFAKLVLQALRARGYTPVFESDTPADGIPTNGSDILLERDGVLSLLACKYGSSAVVDARPLLGLTTSAKLRGAEHVIVVTPGRFEDEAIRLAKEQNMELIDGEVLWPEVRPYVPQPEAVVTTPPVQQTTMDRKLLGMAWGGATATAALVWILAYWLQPEASIPPAPAAAATTTAATSTATPSKTTAAAATAQPKANAVPTDPEQLQKRRLEVAGAISTLFGVDRAFWSTQSTLLVHLDAEEADPLNELCPLLERYPELAASRIQLQPPSGSRKPVRFKQCRTY